MPEWVLNHLDHPEVLFAFFLFVLAGWHARRIVALEDAREKEHAAHLATIRAMQPVLERVALAMHDDAAATDSIKAQHDSVLRLVETFREMERDISHIRSLLDIRAGSR